MRKKDIGLIVASLSAFASNIANAGKLDFSDLHFPLNFNDYMSFREAAQDKDLDRVTKLRLGGFLSVLDKIANVTMKRYGSETRFFIDEALMAEYLTNVNSFVKYDEKNNVLRLFALNDDGSETDLGSVFNSNINLSNLGSETVAKTWGRQGLSEDVPTIVAKTWGRQGWTVDMIQDAGNSENSIVENKKQTLIDNVLKYLQSEDQSQGA